METIRKHKAASAALLVLILLIGSFYFFVYKKPSYALVSIVENMRSGQEVEGYISLEEFTSSVSVEVWKNIQSGSKTLQKFESIDDNFRPFLNKMIASYIKRILSNKSKLIKINQMSDSTYYLLKLQLLAYIAITSVKYQSEDLATISVHLDDIMGYSLDTDIGFKKNQNQWKLAFVENLKI